jgi:hypothetical protein
MTLLLCAAIVPAPGAFSAERAFVPGEVVVKYREESGPGHAVKEAGQKNDRQKVTATVEAVGTQVGLPLKLKQLLSGERILIVIDCKQVLTDVTERLRKRDGVSRVVVSTPEPTGCRTASPMTLKIGFAPGSAEDEALRAATDTSPASQRVLDALQETAGVPVELESMADGELMVTLNIRKTTMQLAERLKRVPDIESSQLNYVMRVR